MARVVQSAKRNVAETALLQSVHTDSGVGDATFHGFNFTGGSLSEGRECGDTVDRDWCHGERPWARLVHLVVCRPDVLGIRISDTNVNV